MHTHTCSGMLAHEHVHARTQTSRVAISQSIAAPAGRRYDLRTATHLRKTAYLPTWCMWHSQPFQRDMSSSEVTTKRYSSCDECTPSALRAHPAERLVRAEAAAVRLTLARAAGCCRKAVHKHTQQRSQVPTWWSNQNCFGMATLTDVWQVPSTQEVVRSVDASEAVCTRAIVIVLAAQATLPLQLLLQHGDHQRASGPSDTQNLLECQPDVLKRLQVTQHSGTQSGGMRFRTADSCSADVAGDRAGCS